MLPDPLRGRVDVHGRRDREQRWSAQGSSPRRQMIVGRQAEPAAVRRAIASSTGCVARDTPPATPATRWARPAGPAYQADDPLEREHYQRGEHRTKPRQAEEHALGDTAGPAQAVDHHGDHRHAERDADEQAPAIAPERADAENAQDQGDRQRDQDPHRPAGHVVLGQARPNRPAASGPMNRSSFLGGCTSPGRSSRAVSRAGVRDGHAARVSKYHVEGERQEEQHGQPDRGTGVAETADRQGHADDHERQRRARPAPGRTAGRPP